MHHKLQAVPIRVLEINAVRIPWTATDLYPMLFQLGFERFVRAALNIEGQMVEIVAGGQGSVTLLLEQGDTLVAAVQKRLRIVFPIDGHAQKLRVELLGARYILHMQDNVIEAVNLDHGSFLPCHPLMQMAIARPRKVRSTRSYAFCCTLYSRSSNGQQHSCSRQAQEVVAQTSRGSNSAISTSE